MTLRLRLALALNALASRLLPLDPVVADTPGPCVEPVTLFLDADDLSARLEGWLLWCAGLRRDLQPWEAATLCQGALATYLGAQCGLPTVDFHPIQPACEEGCCVEQRVRAAASVLRLRYQRDEDGISVLVRVEGGDEAAACDALGATLPKPVRERGARRD